MPLAGYIRTRRMESFFTRVLIVLENQPFHADQVAKALGLQGHLVMHHQLTHVGRGAACAGPIPEALGALIELEELGLNGNELTGERAWSAEFLVLISGVLPACAWLSGRGWNVLQHGS